MSAQRALCCVMLTFTLIILLVLQNLDTDAQVPAHLKNTLQSYSFKDNQIPSVPSTDPPADPTSNSQPSTRIYNSTEVEQRFTRRRNLLRQMCAETDYSSYRPTNNSKLNGGKYKYLGSPRIPLMWCLVPKVGSRYMQDLKEKVFSTEKFSTSQKPKYYQIFLFTREPYSRLISGYFDKLLTDPTWWEFANVIINKFRTKRPKDPKFRCGHDATFTEFLKYFVDSETTGEMENAHYEPVHRVCDVCHHNVDFVGKLETMKEDLRYIYSLINRSSEIEFDNDRMYIALKCRSIRKKYDSVISNFSDCLEFCPMVKIIWWSLQARGILPEGVKFPWTEEKCENLTGAEFRNTATEIYEAVKGSYDRHAQKDKFFRQMYAQVPLTVRLQVRNLLRRECDMFGYVLQPKEVFPEFYD